MPPEHAGWWNDLSFNLQSCERIDHALAVLSNAARNLGFAYCSFGYRDRPPFSAGNIVAMSSYPDAWRSRYREQRYLEIDPVARLDVTSPEPVVWNDDLFMEAPLLWD